MLPDLSFHLPSTTFASAFVFISLLVDEALLPGVCCTSRPPSTSQSSWSEHASASASFSSPDTTATLTDTHRYSPALTDSTRTSERARKPARKRADHTRLGPSPAHEKQTQAHQPAMTDSMPQPQPHAASIPRNDSFSTEDIARAFRASALKPRNDLSLRIVKHDETMVPPPTPHEAMRSFPSSPRDRARR